MGINPNKLSANHPIKKAAERTRRTDKKVTVESQKLIFNKLTPGLNGSDGLRYAHWTKQRRQRQMIRNLVAMQQPKAHAGPVKLIYTRRSVRPMDWDNLGASFKYWGDALVKEGVIEDDNPDIVKEFIPRWEKSDGYRDQKTIIEIKSL